MNGDALNTAKELLVRAEKLGRGRFDRFIHGANRDAVGTQSDGGPLDAANGPKNDQNQAPSMYLSGRPSMWSHIAERNGGRAGTRTPGLLRVKQAL
jgi:hypothetical protein